LFTLELPPTYQDQPVAEVKLGKGYQAYSQPKKMVNDKYEWYTNDVNESTLQVDISN